MRGEERQTGTFPGPVPASDVQVTAGVAAHEPLIVAYNGSIKVFSCHFVFDRS